MVFILTKKGIWHASCLYGAVETLSGSKTMNSICLEKELFAKAERLAKILSCRMVQVTMAGGDSVDGRSSTFVCSAAFEKKLGGQEAVIAKGRAMRAGKLMIIAEDQPAFVISEEFGGKLVRLSLPKSDLATSICDDYGLQLAATLLSDELHVAAGDKVSLDLLNLAKRVAQTDVTVFVNGPTGTGKEVLARFVHNHSSRAEAPFVAVNCAAIPENMLEAILFGHEKGAFTGASTANKGIFRAADGGTLLLDEISEMPMSLQAKLLRVLQEKAVTPIGSHADVGVDVRVLATTNRNMPNEIRQGNFREDLYYRLNVFPLSTTAVADRGDDIVPIVTFLLNRHCTKAALIPWLDESAVLKLRDYSWPGNVRELENVLQRALVLSVDGKVTAAEIITDDSLHLMAGQQLPMANSLQSTHGAMPAHN